MVAYSFHAQFVPAIIDGRKSHTIRAPRKRGHARKGNALQLFTGPRMRPKLIGTATCQGSCDIELDFSDAPRVVLRGALPPKYDAPPSGPDFRTVGVVMQTEGPVEFFARADGFESWAQMRAFWQETHGLGPGRWVWKGCIVFWENFEKALHS